MAKENIEDIKKTVNLTESGVKRKSRGVNTDLQATTAIKFTEQDASKYGLFLGHLERVELKYSTSKDNTASPEFNGIPLANVVLVFQSNHTNISERRQIIHGFRTQPSNMETCIGGSKAWTIDNIFAFMKHLISVYITKNDVIPQDIEEALTLPFYDTDENDEYVSVEAEVVAKGWELVFKNFVKIMNSYNNGKPAFLDDKGHYIPIWFKLTRYYKSNGEWKPTNGLKSQMGNLAFSNFIGSGVIELAYKDKAPSIIKLDLSRESITPKETAKVPNIGINPSPMMPTMSVMPVMQTDSSNTSINNSNYIDDLPF